MAPLRRPGRVRGADEHAAAELGLDDTSYIDITGRDPEDLNENGEFPERRLR